MGADNVVGLVLAVLIVGYLVVALCSRRSSDDRRHLAAARSSLVALVAGRHAAARRLHGQGVRRETAGSPGRPGLRSGRAGRSTASPASTPKREQRWTVYARSVLAFSVVSVLVLYLLQRVQGALPFNPTDVGRGARAARVQHRGQLRDQHQLAELRAASHDEPPHPDGRPGRAELRVGRRRHRRRRRPHPRPGPAPRRRPSATSGSTSPGRSTRVLLPLVRRRGARPRQPGRDPELRRVHRGARTLEGAAQVIPGGPFASQEAIKELGTNGGGPQRQLGPPVREPERVHRTCSRCS